MHSKPIYTYMRNLTNVNTIPSAVNLDNINAVSDNEKATLFNQYFHSVFTSSNFRLPEVPRPDHFIDAITITESDVYHALLSLDPSKAMGCDGISPKLLKHCALPLTPALSILSKFVSTLYIPREWHTHLIRPIYKSGNRNCVRNYHFYVLFLGENCI